MSNIFGQLFQITLFGESHSAAIGIVIDGLPARTKIDLMQVSRAMKRRAPNQSAASTARKEEDCFEILSGYINGITTGTPLAALIRNIDNRSADYMQTADLLRPGHADYTGAIKYREANDIRGGGHFSGRLTAPLVFAGSIAQQFLTQRGIAVGAHIQSIGEIHDTAFDTMQLDPAFFTAIEKKTFATIDENVAEAMQKIIESARSAGDSIGGVVECAIIGLPVGLGEPFFDSMESLLSHMMFSIPAVKGIEFGDGFAITRMNGSAANDCPRVIDGRITFSSNHNGGINGGITNGMPVLFRVGVKPTPSISKRQTTVNKRSMKQESLEIKGRHDACIVPRAVEVIKSACAIVVMDLYLRNTIQRNEI
jgi:chorismate synthase